MSVIANQPSRRRALVTGAAGGIGRAIAAALCADGWEVIVSDVRADAAIQVAQELGRSASGIGLDVADAAAVRAATASICGRGEVTGLVTAAGVEPSRPLDQLDEDEWDAAVAVNLRGHYVCLRALLPSLRRTGGVALCVGSILARAAYPGATAYAAAKAGLEGFVRAAAVDCAPDVRVNCLLPGTTDTPMVRRGLSGAPLAALLEEAAAAVPLRRVARPEEIAAVATFLLSPGAAYMTGSSIVVDGGLSVAAATNV